MSTRRKHGGTPIANFLLRRHDLAPVRDRFMLPLRLIREMLAEGEATEDQWGEMAGMVNVTGRYAQEQKRDDWLAAIIPGANALREISARHDRVGGRWVAKPQELADLTGAINIIDLEVLPTMPSVDFLRIATWMNKHAVDKKEKPA